MENLKGRFANKPVLVIGGTGKTGRRVAERLDAQGVATRIGSRSANPAFDWEEASGWEAAVTGTGAAYVTYYPDLLMSGAAERIGAFARQAVAAGTRRLVLLSGRGEEGAEKAEEALKVSGADWTILRCSWFMQNFNEGYLLDDVLAGHVALPVLPVGEPFIDADDIADVAVTVLGDDRHIGQVYELTGPRLLTFAEAVQAIAEASGREIAYTQVPARDYAQAMIDMGVPEDFRNMVIELFTQVMDGRNESVTGDIEHLLGRKARDFADYARQTALTGVWNPA